MSKEKISKKFDEIHGVHSHDNPYRLKSLCKELLVCIEEYGNSTDDPQMKIRCTQAYSAVAHTMNKEVGWAESAYSKSIKKNAAKIRKKEYRESLEKAINRIHSDILSLLI